MSNITNKEFKIEGREETFRVGKITPTELIAVANGVDFKDIKKMNDITIFALEHTEVLINNSWVSVKSKDKEVYMPFGIENDIPALNNIFSWFLQNVVFVVFTKSEE